MLRFMIGYQILEKCTESTLKIDDESANCGGRSCGLVLASDGDFWFNNDISRSVMRDPQIGHTCESAE